MLGSLTGALSEQAPCVPQHREWLEAFASATGNSTTTARLPAGSHAAATSAVARAFDELIFYRDGYDALDQRIAKTRPIRRTC